MKSRTPVRRSATGTTRTTGTRTTVFGWWCPTSNRYRKCPPATTAWPRFCWLASVLAALLGARGAGEYTTAPRPGSVPPRRGAYHSGTILYPLSPMPLLFSPTEGRLRTGWRLLGPLALLVLLYVAVAIF